MIGAWQAATSAARASISWSSSNRASASFALLWFTCHSMALLLSLSVSTADARAASSRSAWWIAPLSNPRAISVEQVDRTDDGAPRPRRGRALGSIVGRPCARVNEASFGLWAPG
ncbi:hypothetical protein OV079_02165 [Nannocystis pusilla]|uniref:Uncharacterized protein n=1 Tax=Nannocystis pusilla TaxID=889268 RepID=A0A9X3IV00_9BACT|nr:hypothetical protein [Nannocystis pusilla]MCY1004390.1 hypothetical protein [Nannocystis pusilla]